MQLHLQVSELTGKNQQQLEALAFEALVVRLYLCAFLRNPDRAIACQTVEPHLGNSPIYYVHAQSGRTFSPRPHRPPSSRSRRVISIQH